MKLSRVVLVAIVVLICGSIGIIGSSIGRLTTANHDESSGDSYKEKTNTMTGPTIHFRTYGNDVFTNSRERIVREANSTGWFTSAKYWTPEDLSVEFREKYKEILELERGGGYYIWKFDLIAQTMAKDLSEGDILVYLDSGSHVDKGGEKRFFEYVKMVNESKYDMLGFQLHPNQGEYKWITHRLLNAFNVSAKNNTDIVHSPQLESGTLLLQKGPHYEKWMELCTSVIDIDPWMITDKYNKETKYLNPQFKENRHDQSIMSLARKKLGYVRINGSESKGTQTKYPFHVARIRD